MYFQVQDLEFIEVFDLVYDTVEEYQDSRLYQQYIAILPNLDKKHSNMTYADYKKKCTVKPKEIKVITKDYKDIEKENLEFLRGWK